MHHGPGVWWILPLLLALLLTPPAALGAPGKAEATTKAETSLKGEVDKSAPAKGDPDPVETRRRQVETESAALKQELAKAAAHAQEHGKRLAQLRAKEVSLTDLESVRVEVEAVRVRLEDLAMDRQAAMNNATGLEAHIQNLEKEAAPLREVKETAESVQMRLAGLESQLAQQKALVELERQHQQNLEQAQRLAAERLERATAWEREARLLHEATLARSQQAALADLQASLAKEREKWQTRAQELRGEMEGLVPSQEEGTRLLLSARLMEAEERLRLLQVRERLAQSNALLESSRPDLLPLTAEPDKVKVVLDKVEVGTRELEATVTLLQRKEAVLEQQKNLTAKRDSLTAQGQKQHKERMKLLEGLGDQLTAARKQSEETLEQLRRRLQALSRVYEERVRQGMLSQAALPESLDSWAALGTEIAGLPQTFAERFFASLQAWFQGLERIPAGAWLIVLPLLVGWLAAGQALRRLSNRWQQQLAGEEEPAFTQVLLLGLWELLQGNLLPVMVVGAMMIPTVPAAMPPHQLLTLFLPLLVLLGVRLGIDLARLLLVSPRIPAERRHPALYRQLVAMLVIGGLFATVLGLAHVLQPSTALLDLTNRLFMLLLFLMVLPVAEGRRLVLRILAPQLAQSRWLKLLHHASWLLPAGLLFAGALGVVGFVNLGFAVVLHLFWLLLVLGLANAVGHLLQDLVDYLKNQVNLRTSNGVLWAQGVISPLHRLLRLAVWAGAVALLLHAWGWDTHTPVVQWFNALLGATLVKVGNTPLHVSDALLTILILVVVVWLGRWARTLSSRWLLAGIEDIGIRHSLSVFIQYTLVLLGMLAALKVAGVELTNLAIMAGALGVGIGFGLQNIANNFVSGILLLIERPLRTGDLVRIGANEGEVTHIGIRSLTVRTWDNQEVIIPNSEIITHSFINLTHQDSTIRLMHLVGVSYEDDLHRVRQILESVLENHPSILKNPAPVVRLEDFAPSSVNFRIMFSIDLRVHKRVDARSDVLFAIWDAFQANAITIPYPQQVVHYRPEEPSPAPR